MFIKIKRGVIKQTCVFLTALTASVFANLNADAACNSIDQTSCLLYRAASFLLSEDSKPINASVKPASRRNYTLSRTTAENYKTIFNLQEQGLWDEADKIIGRLDNPILFGHVMSQRYLHPTKYKTSYDELVGWLGIYNDHPNAKRIHNLAMKYKPAGAKSVKEPRTGKGLRISSEDTVNSENDIFSGKKRNDKQLSQVRGAFSTVKKELRRANPRGVVQMLNSDSYKKLLTRNERDFLLGYAALSYMHMGKTDKAVTLADEVASRSGNVSAQANWVSGILAWKNKDYSKSLGRFAAAAESPYTSQWMHSGAAYWASRAAGKTGNKPEARKWLKKASEYQRTFYGLIAARSLDHNLEFEWKIPEMRSGYTEILMQEPAGRRALALIDAGQTAAAESELKTINPKGNKELETALIAVAVNARLPGLSMRIAGAARTVNSGIYNSALYPVAPWKINDNTGVDRALISAFIRQESKFDPNARNKRSGAVGLMQLMPRTASSVSNINFSTKNMHVLMKPEINVAIGQQYIAELLNRNSIGNNLIYLAAAYNAGPGKLAKWMKPGSETAADPLLFIETVPVAETRGFIQKVLTNYWIYSMRLGGETSTLDMLADDKWPIYKPETGKDEMRVAFAQ